MLWWEGPVVDMLEVFDIDSTESFMEFNIVLSIFIVFGRHSYPYPSSEFEEEEEEEEEEEDDGCEPYEHVPSVHGTRGLDFEGRPSRPQRPDACLSAHDERKRVPLRFRPSSWARASCLHGVVTRLERGRDRGD